jgi:hypothetical protein
MPFIKIKAKSYALWLQLYFLKLFLYTRIILLLFLFSLLFWNRNNRLNYQRFDEFKIFVLNERFFANELKLSVFLIQSYLSFISKNICHLSVCTTSYRVGPGHSVPISEVPLLRLYGLATSSSKMSAIRI